ncbi:hypothetical protein ACFQV4_29330, partial [Streptomyces thermocarboxydus]
MRADSRYAGEDFRDAVRRVADHMLTGSTNAQSAAELADTLRSELGLHPRWTTPTMATEGTAGETASDVGTTGARTVPTPGTRQPAPAARPETATGTPHRCVGDGRSRPDTTGLTDFDLSVLDGTDLGHVVLALRRHRLRLRPARRLAYNGPHRPGPDRAGHARQADGVRRAGRRSQGPLFVGGEPMEGVEMSSAPALAPSPTLLPAPPTAPAPTTLPSRCTRARPPRCRPRSSPQPRGLRAGGDGPVPRQAGDHRAAGAPGGRRRAAQPPTGLGPAARRGHRLRRRRPGQQGLKRATAARNHFVRQLTQALQQLQQDLPADAPRLTAQDFRVKALAMKRVPDDRTGTGALAGVSRADLGRQATIRVVQARATRPRRRPSTPCA